MHPVLPIFLWGKKNFYKKKSNNSYLGNKQKVKNFNKNQIITQTQIDAVIDANDYNQYHSTAT